MGIAASAIEYNAFWMLNSLVNQYKWHCIGLYNKLKPTEKGRLHYKPIVWSMNRLVTTPEEDDVIITLKKFVKPFPGIRAFGTGLLSTFQPYQGEDDVQKGGGLLTNMGRGVDTVAAYSVVRSFQLLNSIWNEFRWYLLELRRLRKDVEITGVEHTYISTSASKPMGKLLRGKAMFRPIDDPTLNGMENDPPLQKFIDEIHSGTQSMRRASSNSTRRQSQNRRRSTVKNRNYT
jgi:hypothetical protein